MSTVGRRLEQLVIQHAAWSQATFGTDKVRGPEGPIEHLIEEIHELQLHPRSLREYADVFLLLLDALRRSQYTIMQLIYVSEEKLKENQAREWPPIDPANMRRKVNHIGHQEIDVERWPVVQTPPELALLDIPQSEPLSPERAQAITNAVSGGSTEGASITKVTNDLNTPGLRAAVDDLSDKPGQVPQQIDAPLSYQVPGQPSREQLDLLTAAVKGLIDCVYMMEREELPNSPAFGKALGDLEDAYKPFTTA